MTYKEFICSAVQNWPADMDQDSFHKAILLAYHMGLEQGTRQVSNKYNRLLDQQIERAHACRYHNMAMEVQGDVRYLYDSNYAGDVTGTFASDPCELSL